MDKNFLKSLSKDTLLYIPGKILPGLLGFVSLLIYTRLLTPDEYGRYTLVLTIMSFLISILFNWLQQSVLRFHKRYEKKSNELYSTIFSVVVLLSLFVSILYVAITYLFFDFIYKVQVLINLSAILLPLKVIYKTFMQIFRSRRNAGFYSIISVVVKVVYLIFTFLLIYLVGFREESMFIAFIITYFIFILIHLKRLKKLTKFEFSSSFIKIDYIKEFLNYGYPWIGIAIGSFLLSKFDRYVINYFLSTDIVGIYSATYSLAESSIMQFSGLLTISSLPVLINRYEQDKQDNSSIMLRDLFKIYSIIFIPAIFGLVYLSEEIITIILGSEFQGGDIVFIIISIGAFFEAFRNLVGRPFQLKNKTKYLPFLLIFSGIVNMIFNFILVPVIGMEGAAIATLVGYLVYFIIGYMISSKFFEWIIPWETIIKSLVASTVMFVLLFILPDLISVSIINLLANVLAGVTVYFFSLYLLKEEISTNIFNIILDKISLKFGGKK